MAGIGREPDEADRQASAKRNRSALHTDFLAACRHRERKSCQSRRLFVWITDHLPQPGSATLLLDNPLRDNTSGFPSSGPADR
ncbi:hypothetical protein D9M68_602240 [compost metagenome]